jgi:hypothetical protein
MKTSVIARFRLYYNFIRIAIPLCFLEGQVLPEMPKEGIETCVPQI